MFLFTMVVIWIIKNGPTCRLFFFFEELTINVWRLIFCWKNEMCVSILKYTPYLTDALDEDLVSAKFTKNCIQSQYIQLYIIQN